MSSTTLLLVIVGSIAGAAAIFAAIQVAWRAIGRYRISRAGPRPLASRRHVLWRDPGAVAALDLATGPGGPDGAPVPPFHFIQEHALGSQPCVSVRDGRGRRWRVKWGQEVQAECFAVRLVWACGYFGEVTYFVPAGHVYGAGELARAKDCIGPDCAFVNARFELDDPAVRKLFEEHSWSWDDNPFLDSRELHGLKVLVMLLSDWDTKDRRDVARGSNTAIFEVDAPAGREAQYLITDWGGSMGRWGSTIVTRGRWDPDGYAAQTPQFVTGIADGIVQFGYSGQRTADVAAGIRLGDVRWLHQRLGRLTDAQLRAALDASGATEIEIEAFVPALRARIDQLGTAAVSAADAGAASPAASPGRP